MFITLFVISCFGGFVSGLLGVGGAVVLIPLFLSIPPLVGAGQLSMHEVAGITMIQVLISSLLGLISHGRSGHVDRRTVLWVGIPLGGMAFLGSAVSRYMPGNLLLLIFFGCLVIVAFFMLLKKAPGESEDRTGGIPHNPAGAVIVGGSVGLISGIVGAGGGFMVIPLMVRALKIPMRTAVGSSLGIVFIGALLGSAGKVLTMQVPWAYLIPVAGSIPAALIGSWVSKVLKPAIIRYLLLTVVFLAAVTTWIRIFRNV